MTVFTLGQELATLVIAISIHRYIDLHFLKEMNSNEIEYVSEIRQKNK